MQVGNRMSTPAISVHPDIPLHEALQLMRKENIRRLPVVSDSGKLVGIVSESDLLHASPSDATTLSVWELNYLLSKIEIRSVMTKKVVTVSEETPLEEAARIMCDNKIGGLPVVKDDTVVGIITETDLFKLFLELLGARESGLRVTALVTDAPGALAKVAAAIADLKGNIIALGTFLGESSENRTITLKVRGPNESELRSALDGIVESIVDLRMMEVA